MCAHVSTFVQSDRHNADTGGHQMDACSARKPIGLATAVQNRTHKSTKVHT